jgi:hypothetical protein
MKNLLEVDDSIIRDISREPKVKKKNAPREVTHTITLVPPNYIETLWEDVKHHLAKAVIRSRGRWSLESLKEALIHDYQSLWLAFDEDHKIDGIGTTEIIEYPGKKMLAVQFLGGDNFNDWVWDINQRFQDWAKENGCSGIEATARMGFWKWLEQDGYERAYVIYEKRFVDG